jgi:hypothetical protein
MGKESILQSKIEAKWSPSFLFKFNGIISHFKKIIFIPDKSSNPINIHLKAWITNSEASKNNNVLSEKWRFIT